MRMRHFDMSEPVIAAEGEVVDIGRRAGATGSPPGPGGRGMLPRMMDAAMLDGIDRVRELDPSTVDDSPFVDRLADTTDDLADLEASIARGGQHSPVMVRPHPRCPARYELIFGHRRTRVMRRLKRAVRALVVDMADDDAVKCQVEENAKRSDLSFSEKAMVIFSMRERGYPSDMIADTMNLDPKSLRDYLPLLHEDVRPSVIMIGKAPKTGRRPWIAMAGAARAPGAREAVEAAVRKSDFEIIPSDARFEVVSRALRPWMKGAGPKPEPAKAAMSFDLKGRTITVRNVAFLRFLKEREAGLMEEFERSRKP